MALHLSKEDRKWLKADLNAAEPYEADDPILGTLDGDIDIARYRATMAKHFLEQDDKEKAELGLQLEGQY